MGTVLEYLRKRLKSQIESFLDIKIYSNHAHGREDWFDIKRVGSEVMTIFDVGANIGQSAIKFRRAFPDSKIFCFEPVESVFAKLAENLKGDERVSLHKIALADSSCQKTIYLTADSMTNGFESSLTAIGTASVPTLTVDEFARENAIDRIDLLKVDVEGYDLRVLEGAKQFLQTNRIVFVIAEVGFNESDSLHVSFENVRSFLASHGYSVFGIYDQQLEWSGQPQLRYANVCFINEKAMVNN